MDTIRGLKAGAGAGIISGLTVLIISIVLAFVVYNEYTILFEQVSAKIFPSMPTDILIMISEIIIIILNYLERRQL